MKYQNTGIPSRIHHYLKRFALSRQAKVLLSLAAVAAVASVSILTRAGDPQEHGSNTSGHQNFSLEGSWTTAVSPILPPGAPPITFQTYATYIEGGTSIGSDRTKPFASPQHGTWVHLQGHEYAGTFVQDLFDQAGTFLGTFKGRTRIELIGKDEFIGVANVEQRDPGGSVILNRCARFHGVRIGVEPLAAPCDGLEPGM
jgi:hypothetical protein